MTKHTLGNFRKSTAPAPAAPPTAPAPAPPKDERVRVVLRCTPQQRRRIEDLANDNRDAGKDPRTSQAVLEAALDLYFQHLGLAPLFKAD